MFAFYSTLRELVPEMRPISAPGNEMDACSLQKALRGNRCNTTRLHFEVSEDSELQFPSSSGLSQGLKSHHLSEPGSMDDEGLSLLDSQLVTPETSAPQISEQATSKKPKKR
ncbi:uncharacterized protein PV06_11936 [Exophiala oligosperma]|uniref:Uncharacterized protein n=1 Tax=Exophiala oligosperma TaxID=215243 RepID=A0A0D2CXB3_9EURO|nr:uncharacterized protein PV06_11936 [Exophiala oligosperma]KIW35723.1 hypothetical protein PV06_11936 [Exophiala oligosperma]